MLVFPWHNLTYALQSHDYNHSAVKYCQFIDTGEARGPAVYFKVMVVMQ